jgi:macrolide phosphotransferase
MEALQEDTTDTLRTYLDPPDRATAPVVLEVGTSSVVVQFGQSVARVARNQHAAAGHAREVAVLPLLVDRLPVAVPAPCRLVPPQPSVPHGAAIQPLLPGQVMSPSDVRRHPRMVDEIARTLSVLHGIGPGLFPPGTLPEFDPIAELRDLRRAVGPWLKSRLPERQWRRLSGWWTYSARVLSSPTRVVSHADAWFGNMLVDEGGLVALLDWEDACLADPAMDLAPQRYLGPEAATSVVASYVELRGQTRRLEERIECYRLLREVGGLAYALGQGMEEEYDDGLAKVVGLLD